MQCKCGKNAENKIIDFCCEKHNIHGRYILMCNECLITSYAKANCGKSDKCINALIVREFNWVNAYTYANDFKFVFTDIKEHEENPEECECVYDDDQESTIHEIIPFPYGENDADKLPYGWKLITINLAMKYNSETYFITRDKTEWSLQKTPQEFKALIKSNGEAKIFIQSCHFTISEKNIKLAVTNIDDIKNISKFKLCNYEQDKTKGHVLFDDNFVYWIDDYLTIDEKKGKKRIFWNMV